MKRRDNLLLLLSLLCHSVLFAQRNTIIKVKAGHTIEESVPTDELYEYPQFTPGVVFFKDGNREAAILNYNRYLDRIRFVTGKSDTFTLINKNIKFITIGTDTFFTDQGSIKLLQSIGSVKLGIKQTLHIIDREKLGGYGTTSSISAIESYSSYDIGGIKTYGMTVMQDLILEKTVQYFVGNLGNDFVLADKKNLIKLFPKQEHAIASYMKENTINFANKEDLEKLLRFFAKR